LIHGTQDALWIRKLVEQITGTEPKVDAQGNQTKNQKNQTSTLEYLGLEETTRIQISISEDNKSVIEIIKNENIKMKRTKHGDLAYKWLMQTMSSGDISTNWIPTKSQPADPLTKNTTKEKLSQFQQNLKLIPNNAKL